LNLDLLTADDIR